MNHLSRQGIIAFLAAVVTTTSMAERSSSSQCTDGGNYSIEVPFPGSLGYCPGIDVVNGFTRPFQYQDDFPGNYPLDTPGNSFPRITSTYEFWVDGKKNETLQCFKSKGYNRNVDVSEDGGSQTVTVRGHIVLGLGPYEQLNYKFSGLNPNNITGPGLYYMQVSLHLTWCVEKRGYHVFALICAIVSLTHVAVLSPRLHWRFNLHEGRRVLLRCDNNQ